MTQSRAGRFRPLFWLLALQALSYLLYHSLAGGTLLTHSPYDSYALLAECWKNGTLYLPNGENYAWLELAIYEGQYYISFPPVPALVLLPIVLLAGYQAVPSNLIAGIYGLLASAGVYCLCEKRLGRKSAVLWASLCVTGSNLYWMTTNGGVWFQAQALCFVLCVWGLYFASCGGAAKSTLGAFLMALAVGCRPFSILLLGGYMLILLKKEWLTAEGKLHAKLPGRAFWLPFFAAALVGAALAAYNYARFGSIAEFGHTYLPEFQRLEYGQFHPHYLLANLLNLIRPVTLTADLDLNFPLFNGFLFFIANPVFLLWFIRLLTRAAKHAFTRADGAAALLAAAGVLLLCFHETLGGWQFGARYTVDLIPYVLAGEALRPDAAEHTPRDWEWALCAAAVLFNLYGAVYMLSH